MKTNELTGVALDWAVAKCEGLLLPDGGNLQIFNKKLKAHPAKLGTLYTPSTDWAQGGSIIDNLMKGEFFMMENGEEEGENACHVAYSRTPHDNFHGFGPTPLIAAMRCYVASKMGDTVEVPPELLE